MVGGLNSLTTEVTVEAAVVVTAEAIVVGLIWSAMSVVSLVTLHVNAVTAVAQEGVAAGAGVAVLDTGGVQATDAGQCCCFPYFLIGYSFSGCISWPSPFLVSGVTALVLDLLLLLLQGAVALHLLLLVVVATVDHHLRTEGVRNCLILMGKTSFLSSWSHYNTQRFLILHASWFNLLISLWWMWPHSTYILVSAEMDWKIDAEAGAESLYWETEMMKKYTT